MPFGINLRASEAATPYWDLVDRVSAFETTPTVRALGYPPHITLAKYDDAPPGQLEQVVTALSGASPITLTFDRLRSFDQGYMIIWASPQPHQGMRDLHFRIHDAIDPSMCKPAYRPSDWTPHCSVALRIAEDQREAARQLLTDDFDPFALTFDVLDCVSSPPITILAERPLQAHRNGS